MTRRAAAWLLPPLTTLVAVVAGYRATPGLVVGPGSTDALVFRNFYAPVDAPAGPRRYSHGAGARSARDGEHSVVALPQIGRTSASTLDLDLFVPARPGLGPLVATLAVAGRVIATPAVLGPTPCSVALDAAALPAGDLKLTLTGPSWSTPDVAAHNGVGVARVAWRPAAPVAPPWRQLVVWPASACLLAVLLLRLGAPRLASLGAGTAAGVVLGFCAGALPLRVAPFGHRVLLGLVLTHAALAAWSAFVAGATWPRLPAASGVIDLLVLMSIGYWTMLVFEWALHAETGRGAPPQPATLAIGALAWGALLFAAWHPTPRPALVAVLAVAAAAQGVAQAAFALRRPAADFTILWQAVHEHAKGGDLYDLANIHATPFGDIFKVPPFYGMILLPLAWLSRNRALAAHRAIDCALYLTIAVLILRWLRPRLGTALAAALVAIVMGSMRPPFDTIAYGQIDVVLLLLLTVTLLALGGERLWLAGLGIAAGALFKIYPLMLAGMFLNTRRWRGLVWTSAWLLVLNALSVAALGWRNLAIYVTDVFPRIGGGTSWVENQALHGFLSRLVTGRLASVPSESPLVNGLTYAAFAVVSATLVSMAARRVAPGSSLEAVQVGAFVLAMVLVGPNAWMHYETILVLTFVALVLHAAERPYGPGQAFLLGAGFALVAYGNQWSFFDGGRAPGIPALALSYKFYGMAGLAALTFGLLRAPGYSAPVPSQASAIA